MRHKRLRRKTFVLNGPEEESAVPIAGDAAIATVIAGDGRLIPLLILDTTKRPDLEEAIRLQSTVPSGDVTVQWGHMIGREPHVTLFLSFVRPTNRNALVEFDIEKRGILVESILTVNALYIQSGRPGDRFIHDPNRLKILIEVPDTGFRPYWNKIFRKHLMSRFRQAGYSRMDAKQAVQVHLKHMRDVVKFRMPS